MKNRINLLSLLLVSIVVLFTMPIEVFSQNTTSDLRKTVYDEDSKISYNNFRTDSSEVVFYMVKVDKDLMYKKPNKNSEVIFSLKSFSFVEFIKKSKSKKYYKVRIFDSSYDFVEGWVRKKTLKNERYYGLSLKIDEEDKKDKEQVLKVISENEISPYWVKANSLNVFANNNLTGEILKQLKIGDQVFVSNVDINSGVASINIKETKGVYLKGFVAVNEISEILLFEGKTDFENLFKMFDQSLLENDIISNSFLSYKIIKIKGTYKEKIIEDKRCRVLNEDTSADSLAYKATLSNNKYKFIETNSTIGNMKNNLYSMYRILPKEKIFMSNDTLDCDVIEIVYKPRASSIELGGVKEGKILNKKAKLYIHKSKELDNLQVVIQRKEDIFEWSYKYNLDEDEYIKNIYDKTVKIKRMVAFKKY